MPTERLPLPLSERLSTASQALFARQGREVDIAIAGIPFRLATTPDIPHSIETIPIRRDQFDTENDPGEQSLTSWWRRSQSSFHEGAGDLYQENSDRSINSLKFFDSEGVDVFTPGRLTLLKKMETWANAPGTKSRVRSYTGTVPGAAAHWISDGVLWRNIVGANPISTHSPIGKTIVDAIIAGPPLWVYDITSDGTLYSGSTSNINTSPTTWPLGATPSRLAWGKHRLWVIGGRRIWQPDLNVTSGTTQAPIFTSPNQGWTYTCLAEGPTGMLFGGHDGNSSSIQLITLDESGGVPALSGAAVTAALPAGELVQEIGVLAGQFIGIGTNRGFRVGIIDGTQITYGPLIVEPEGVTACTALVTQGRYFVVAFDTDDSRAIAYRVDTGTSLDGGVFPYAKDIDCGVGSINSLAAPSGSQLVASTGTDLTFQSPDEYVDTGYLQTGRIRFRTTEPKSFKSLHLEIDPLQGAIQADLIIEGGSTLPLGNLTQTGEVFEDKFEIKADKMRYASVKLTLAPTANNLAAPVIHSYQLRAIPAVAPQRLYTLPLLCFDKEQARSGQWYGGKWFARDRMMALQEIEDDAETVTLQEFSVDGTVGKSVTIEGMRFIRSSPPNASVQNDGSPGGILLVQLRTAEV